MDKLIQFLNTMTPADQAVFARACGTSVGYLRKAASKGQKLGAGLCINIERESGRQVRCEHLDGSADWAFIRGTLAEDNESAEEAMPAPAPPHSAAAGVYPIGPTG